MLSLVIREKNKMGIVKIVEIIAEDKGLGAEGME